MLEKRVDVLDEDAHLGLGVGGDEDALDHVGADALLVDNVFADDHRALLQLLDGNEDGVVDVLFGFEVTAQLGDLAGEVLDEVGVIVYSGLEECGEYVIARGIAAGAGEELAHGVVERGELLAAYGDEGVVLDDERDRLLLEV